VRKILRRYGINDDAEFTQPLVEMQLGKPLRLVLNWLTLNTRNGYEIEMRMQVPEEQMTYTSSLVLKRSAIRVRYIHATPGLLGEVLHQWDTYVSYETLTLEEIQCSVDRANATNAIREKHDIMQNYVDNFVVQQLMSPQEEKQAIPNITATEEMGPTKPPKVMKQSSRSD